MYYFRKELIRNKLNLPDGRKLTFEDLGDGNGVLATEDTFVTRELHICINRQTHGVSEIDAMQYEELKKNAHATTSQGRQVGQRFALSAQNLIHGHSQRAVAAVVKPRDFSPPAPEPPPAPPIKVQKEFIRPTTRKLFKEI